MKVFVLLAHQCKCQQKKCWQDTFKSLQSIQISFQHGNLLFVKYLRCFSFWSWQQTLVFHDIIKTRNWRHVKYSLSKPSCKSFQIHVYWDTFSHSSQWQKVFQSPWIHLHYMYMTYWFSERLASYKITNYQCRLYGSPIQEHYCPTVSLYRLFLSCFVKEFSVVIHTKAENGTVSHRWPIYFQIWCNIVQCIVI